MSYLNKSRLEAAAIPVVAHAKAGASAPYRRARVTDISSASAAGIYRSGLKRALDLSLIVMAAPIVVPVIGVLAGLVALGGGHPFYVQPRVGHGGRVFKMWKLRSMVMGADARLDAHLASDPAARQEWDIDQKLKDDPRITAMGRLLRKTSLDELPQLWNVFRGDMSLVGPRPMMPCQQDLYTGQAYYRLRPGITGPWQVSARNDSSFADRAKYDREYDQTLCFAGDVGLLVRTVRVVVLAKGH